MRKSTIGTLLLLLTATGSLLAQTGAGNKKRSAIFNLPSSVPVPCWVTICDWEHPNIYKIDSTIEACEKNEVHAKTGEEEENDEEPYRVAYIRWRESITPFIQANGAVVEDPGYYNRLLATAINAQGNKNKNARVAATTANGSWTILGPIETYEASKNKDPLQANIFTLAIAPSNPSIVYAGADTGAIYRSTDKGLHWASISDNWPPFNTTSIAVDPANANTVYAISLEGQLIKTVNAGASWTSPDLRFGTSEKITINKTTGRILVAGETGVDYSDDGGTSWLQADGIIADRVYDVEINALNPNIVYAVGTPQNGTNSLTIFRSVNGGDAFTAVNAPAFNNIHCFGARFGVTPANGNTVYCINLDDDLPELFKSTDGGISWNIIARGKSTAFDMGNNQGFYDLDIMVSPNNENQLITGTYDAFKSVDGGFNFTRLSESFRLHVDMQCMRTNGNDAWIATDGGVNYSTDFFTNVSNSSVRNNGLTYKEGKRKIPWQTNIYSFAITPSNPAIVYAGAETGAIYRSADKGLHWASITDNLPPFEATSIAVDPANANIVYAISNMGQLIKSVNAGSSWDTLDYHGGTSEKITISKTTGRILVAGKTGVYFSNNGGTTWQPASGSNANRIWDVEINPGNNNIVYAVGHKPHTAFNNQNKDSIRAPIIMFRSTDGGASFTAVNSASLNNVYSTSGARFGVTPANGNTVYCITLDDDAPRLLKSTDAGLSWNITVTGKSTALDMNNGQGFYDLDMMVSPTNENQVILGTLYALKSVDGGFNFTRLSDAPFPLHADIQCMRSLGNDAWITTDGGVSYSSDFFTNVSNWSARNTGLTGSDFWGFGQGWDQDIVVGGRYHNGDVALFENYGPGNSLYTGGAEAVTGHVFHGQKNTVGFSDEGTKQLPSSLPGNMTYAEYANTLWPQNDDYGTFSSKLMIDPRYSNTFYVGMDNTLWKSINRGVSYSALHDFGSKVWRFDIARSNSNTLYVCAENGLYKTTDSGASWITLSLPSGVAYKYYNADIAVDQLNENIVFLCMARGTSGNKVFKSTNGGSTWTNYTGSLTNAPIAFITPQAGTNGGVYAFSNLAPAKVYYRDNTMADWVDFSNGLPLNFKCKQGGIIFYRDSKLRIAGNRGVWESPLFGAGTPVAQPMANKQFISCSRDTVSFIDYSNVNYAGAQWKWTFPGASYVSSTTAREPKVVYQLPGSYPVSLEVTDAAGNKHTRTVNQMITFTQDNCLPDTVAGKCLKMDGNRTAINLGRVNINSNNFSISCWIKPDGMQAALSQILAHDAYPGSSFYGFGLGFSWQGGASNLELSYTDNIVTFGNHSGLIADSTAWNFVVLTYSPTGVKIYLNGVPSTFNSGPMPVIDLSQSPFYVNRDIHGQRATYKGAIDEIKFYDYALTQNEVREKMHLIQSNGAAETGLLKYFQFNKYDSAMGVVQDVAGLYQAPVPANLIIPSTAPVASGKVFRKPDVNAGGQHSFPGTGVDLFLKNGATYPNGEVVAFQLNSPPDRQPDSLSLVPHSGYFILNNYGSNKTFTVPDSIRFNGGNIDAAHGTADFNLYSRPSVAWGNTWASQISRSTGFNFVPGNSTITFGTGNNITGFGQFALSALVKADTVAGKCLKMDGSLTDISLGKVNINSNNFSISCWIKPDGLQRTLSQIVGWNPEPALGKGFGLGFAFDPFAAAYEPNLKLSYTDTIVGWSNVSGLKADTATWNFVVLTYSPTGVKIYLNGVPATVNNGPMPVLNLSQYPFYVNRDIHKQLVAYKGAVDEIKFYNYALSQNEVREKMHLIQSDAAAETGLLKYFQFNQYNSATGTVPDIMSDFKAYIPNGSFITASTAPVATGRVFRKPDVNTGGQHSFPGTGIDLFLKNGATYPNGEVVAFQLNSPPDKKPDNLSLVPRSSYFIINNYGSNKTFTAPDSIRFNDKDIDAAYRVNDFHIYSRPSGAWGNTWGAQKSLSTGFIYVPGNSTITFGAGNNVTGFGQFALSAFSLKADTVAGKCLKMDGSNTAISLGKVNINSNNFSISCWIKPDGMQSGLAQFLAHDPYPTSSYYGFGLGFTWQGGASNLELSYTDDIVNFANQTGLFADSTAWNFVVLTYSPTGVKIYLNGVRSTFISHPSIPDIDLTSPPVLDLPWTPVIDLSQSPFYVNRDIHGQRAGYKGAIDEIKFYNYALTQNEVREKMHLIQSNGGAETGLLKYFQFNQYDSATGTVADIMSDFKAAIPSSAFITTSTAPVATGSVFRKPDVSTGGQHSFPGTGIDLFLKNGATYPDGEVVAFQLNSPPDRQPDSLSLVPHSGYFILNNYGSNKTFTVPDSIRFNGGNIDAAHGTADFNLYSRPSVAWGNTWASQISRSTGFNFVPGNSTITFGTGNNITGFGQFALSALVKADTVAGKCLKMDGSETPISLGKVNINSNNFSISCWIKPDGLQAALSQILGWNPNPALGKGFGLGFAFDPFAAAYEPNLKLSYTDTIVGWSNVSGLKADTATWNFVVLTYSPTGVKIYLNGVPATVNNGPMPVLNLSQYPFYVNRDIHAQHGAYKGAIEEIKFYNYALSQNEVREKMHLIQSNAPAETGLLKYFQFNQYNSATGTVPDMMSDFKAYIPNGSFITASTAPVATGRVFRKPDVNTGGQHSFPGTGIDLFLKNGATYPNGEVVAFQLNSPPDKNPDALFLVPGSHYFIINNYGSNKTFTVPDSIKFSGLDIASSNYNANDFKIYKRASCAWGSTWSTDVRQAARFGYAPGNSTITFNNQSNVTSFGQIAISAPVAQSSLVVARQANALEPDNVTYSAEFYPNPNKGWGYLNITSPHDNAHVGLYLHDIDGNTVYQASEQLSSNKSLFMLNFNALSSGTYILQIRFNTGELITKKVTIVK